MAGSLWAAPRYWWDDHSGPVFDRHDPQIDCSQREQRDDQCARVPEPVREPHAWGRGNVGLPPPIPRVGRYQQATHDTGEGHPGGDISLSHPVDAAGHTPSCKHHPDAEQESAESRVDSEWKHVGRGRVDA